MTTAYTSLLGLALPVTGELSGTWGDTVNTAITTLLDSAIAGTTTLSTDADVTLTTTTGAANTSRQAILLCSGARTVLRTITAPAQSKIYTVINSTTGGFSVKIVGVGPTTGVTIVAGESALVAWNGSDFIKVSNTGGSASFTNVTVTGTTTLSGLTASTALALDASKNVVSVTNTGTGSNVLAVSPTLTGTIAGASLSLSSLTSGRVPYATTAGLLTDSANLTFNGTTTLSVSSSLSGASNYMRVINSSNTANSGALLSLQTGGTSGGTAAIEYYNQTTAIYAGATTSYGYYFVGASPDGSTPYFVANSTGLGVGTSSPAYKLDVKGNIRSGLASTTTGEIAFFSASNDSQMGLINNATEFKIYSTYASTAGYKPINFYTSDALKMTLTTAGNLVIGTTATDNKFLVYGGVASVSGTDGGGATVPSAAHVSSSTLRIGLRGSVATSDNSGLAAVGTYYSDNAFFRNASGNAGYIVTAAASQLALYNGTAALRYAASGTSNTDISWSTGLYMTNAGLIGINTTDPLASLQINSGDIRLQGSAPGKILFFSTGNGVSQNATLEVANDGATTNTGEFKFSTKNQSTTLAERVRITADGNLLVGTVNNVFSSRLCVQGTAGSSTPDVLIGIPLNASSNTQLQIYRSAAVSGYVGFETVNAAVGGNDLVINAINGGGLLVNTTTRGDAKVRISANANAFNILKLDDTGSTGGNFVQFLNSAGNQAGSINHNGTTSVNYGSGSDYRLKDITGPVTNAADFINSLKPKVGTWKADGSKFVGFLAHEFAEVCPQAVVGEKDGVDAEGKPLYQSMEASSSEVIANIVSLLQEQQAIIESLKARLDAANL